MALEKIKTDNYVSILSSDGTLRMVVPEGTDGAVKREYETSDGKKGVKHELVFNKLTGKITDVSFFDGDFGKLIQITVKDGDEEVILSVNTAQNFGEDLMKKLPNIDLSKDVVISPYSFEDENGKTEKGVSITQDGEKIKNYYYDEKKKETINDFPKPEGDTAKYDKDDWKTYFIKARKFLIKQTEKNFKTLSKVDEEYNKI